ncbi:helix-turn-helix transcriptional regulator [Kocuria sp. U4B]
MGGVRRSHYRTQDPEQALAALGQVYTRLRMGTPVGGRFRLELAAVALEAVSVETVDMRCPPITGGLEGTGVVRVGHLRTGRFGVATASGALPGAPIMLFPSTAYTGWWEDLGLTTVTMPVGVVEDHARALLDAPAFRLHFTGHTPGIDPRYWRATVGHLIGVVLPNEAATASPLIRAQVVQSVVTAVLHTFPSTFTDHLAHDRPQAAEPVGVVSGPVRRAVAFIDTHLGEPIGVVEIAAAARLSPRGLQAAFRRQKGTTPMAYLRTTRLAAAHTDLLAADPGAGVTVAAIAARWGFAHPGRFAGAYRAAYGESPAATLHR